MHGLRQPVHLVTGLEADGERLSCRLCGPARRFHRGIDLRQRQPCMVEKGLARCGQLDAMNAARQQLGPDLVFEVGAELLSRSVHGVKLTAAGKAFLDHARLALAQVDAAVEAARRAAQPARKAFAIGFQTGHEMNWLPRAMYVLRDELKSIQVTVSSDYSPNLAAALVCRPRALALLAPAPA